MNKIQTVLMISAAFLIGCALPQTAAPRIQSPTQPPPVSIRFPESLSPPVEINIYDDKSFSSSAPVGVEHHPNGVTITPSAVPVDIPPLTDQPAQVDHEPAPIEPTPDPRFTPIPQRRQPSDWSQHLDPKPEDDAGPVFFSTARRWLLIVAAVIATLCFVVVIKHRERLSRAIEKTRPHVDASDGFADELKIFLQEIIRNQQTPKPEEPKPAEPKPQEPEEPDPQPTPPTEPPPAA